MSKQLKALVKQRYGLVLAVLLSPFIAWQLKKSVKHLQDNLETLLQQDWS